MIQKYFATKRVCRSSRALVIYVDKDWGIGPSEYVNMCIRIADMSRPGIYCTKKVCRVGSGLCLFLNKEWGFKPDDMVLIVLKRHSATVNRPGETTAVGEDDVDLTREFDDDIAEPW